MTRKPTTADPYSRKFWNALVGLEEAVDDLSTRILKRTADPPPKTSPRASARAKVATSEDASDLYIERMKKLAKTVSILRDCLDAPAQNIPTQARRRNLRRIVHPEIEGNADTALRARVGRAARRYGLSFNEWVDRYGLVDKLPERQ